MSESIEKQLSSFGQLSKSRRHQHAVSKPDTADAFHIFKPLMSCYSVCFNVEMQHQSRAQQALQYTLHPVFNHEEVRVLSGKLLEGSKHTKRRNCSSKAVRVMSDYFSDKIKRSVCLRRIFQLLSGLLMRGLERDYKSMSYFKHVKIDSIAYRRCR